MSITDSLLQTPAEQTGAVLTLTARNPEEWSNIAQLRKYLPESVQVIPACNHSTGRGLARDDRDVAIKDKMQITPEITFERSESSAVALELISKEIKRLETHNQRITGCRVSVIAPSHKHRHGNGFHVHIWVTLPPHENIVVSQSHTDDARHEHVEVAIRDAFAIARRQIDALAI